MSISNVFKSSVVLALLACFVFAMPAQATSNNSIECSVKMVGSSNSYGKPESRWILNDDGTVTGTLKVTGDEDCRQTVTLAAWEAPDADKGMPYDEQKLVDHITKTFRAGTHTMSIKLPMCFYQIDMVRGSKVTGENGLPVYPSVDMMGSLHGGTTGCKTPEVPKTPETPQELPKTGAGSNILLFAMSATILGTTFKYFRQLRTA